MCPKSLNTFEVIFKFKNYQCNNQNTFRTVSFVLLCELSKFCNYGVYKYFLFATSRYNQKILVKYAYGSPDKNSINLSYCFRDLDR